jgi:hypothetical protein
LKTELHIVWGQDAIARAQEVQIVLADFSWASRTVLASSEIFSLLNVEAQARLIELDLARKAQGIHMLRLTPGCMCCSSKLVLSTHLARTLRFNRPEIMVLELDSQSHPEQVGAMLREPQWANWFSEIQMREVNKKPDGAT